MNPEKISKFSQKYEASQLLLMLTVKIVSWASNHHIRMISEGLCDTEDRSNDAENSALPSQELLTISKCIKP